MKRPGLLLLVALLAGCGTGADDERNAAEAARVGTALEQVAGVLDAEVVHVQDPSTPGVAQVTLVVDPGTPTTAVREAVAEALWLSRMDPLLGFRIEVQEPDGSYRRDAEPLRFAEEGDELQRRFGPRPVPGR